MCIMYLNSPLEEYPDLGRREVDIFIHPGASATPQEGNPLSIKKIIMMNKKNIVMIVVVVLVVVGVGFWVNKVNTEAGYSVVYLSTGEIYVGKLTTFPDLELKNAYILLVIKDTTDPTKSNFQLNPVSEALWAPQSIHLVKEHVVFYGSLLANSKIAQTLTAKGK